MSFQHDMRVVLYPHYITAGKSVAEGRRIPKELACDNPNVLEMMESCKELQLPTIIEDKHYPRDWFIRCRLRVQLKNSDGTLVNPEVPDRRTLLIKISALVPKHKKVLQQTAGASVAATAPSIEASSAASSSSKAQAGGKTNKKKKGK